MRAAHAAVEASGEAPRFPSRRNSRRPFGTKCVAAFGDEMGPAKRAHMGARKAACLAAIEAMPAVEAIPASVAVAAVIAWAVAIREADRRPVVTIVIPSYP